MSTPTQSNQQYPLIVGMLINYYPLSENTSYVGTISGIRQDDEGVYLYIVNARHSTRERYYLHEVIVKPILSSP